ncbi:acid phosphatase [Nesidiocoris tenuis]|uniref:acid phosphatase n=1 Tax=Nesidiocoris tenuis TaxID=355587 RepID=A0ABN7AIP9_9HEMI|nr:acid phosphatase [Nesidiocoris tenuis]
MVFQKVVVGFKIFRHGDRTPIKPYPKDPYMDPSYWPLGYGQLTKRGIYHQFVQGSWVGQRYAHLLPKDRNYNRKAIRVQSTDVDRTLMSAEAHLAGLFPLTDEEKWGGINWQPVPIHTIPETLDKVVAMKYPCKKYLSEQKKFLSSDEYKAIMKKFESLGNFLIKYAGGPFNTLDYFEYLYSTLQIEKNNNLTLPEWTNGVYPDQLLAPAGLSFATPTWTPGMKRLRGGPLVKEVMVNMEEKIAGKLNPPSQNISIYSAHDTTVAAFLNSLDMFNFLPPPFASMVLLELRKTAQNDYAVVVLYKNSTDPTVDPHILTVPGCFDACPIKDMEALIQPIIPGDWDSECHQHEFFDLTSDQPYNSVAIFAIFTSTLIVFLALATISVYCSKQSSHTYQKLNVGSL